MSQDRTGEIIVKLDELIDLVKNSQTGNHVHYHYYPVGGTTPVTTPTTIPTTPSTYPYWQYPNSATGGSTWTTNGPTTG